MDMIETLTALNRRFGPSGQEGEVAEAIGALARPYADEVVTDVMGNLIVHKKGPGPRVMFAAHMDSLGLMVTHIEESGLARVGRLGGVSPREAPGTPVRFRNGVTGVVYEDDGLEESAKREMGHLYLDIGAKDAQEAKGMVQVGDVAIYDTPIRQNGSALFSPYLDNRISCAALLKALALTGESKNDLYFVFTVQEEVGLRGARTAAFAIAPDYAVVADVTVADDLPGGKRTCSARCGGGAAIKVMDTSVICHPQMVEKLKALAEKEKIPYQLDVIAADGDTDGGPIHQSRAGVITGGVSVPCRHIHCAQETVWTADAEACAALMAAFARSELEPLGRCEE